MASKRYLSIAVIVAAMVTMMSAAPAVARTDPSLRKPRIEIGLAGLHVDLPPLAIGEVLQLIAEKTGARIFLYGDRLEKISAQFVEPSLANGLRRLLRSRDLMIFYKESPNGQPTLRLAELHVFNTSVGRSDQIVQFAPTSRSSADLQTIRLGQSGRKVLSPALAALAKQLLESKDSQQRKDAAAALARSGEAAAIDVLSQSLANDSDASVREAVANALGKSWDEAAVEPLARSLSDDRSAAVRDAAAAALGATWSENAVTPLLQALANDRDALVREQAARALGNSAGEEAVAALAQSLAQDPRWSVREAAAIALGSIGGSDARDALVRAADTDSDPWVKEAGLMSILDMAN